MPKTTIIFDCFGVICSESFRPWMLKNLGGWDSVKDYFVDVADRFDLDTMSEDDVAREFDAKSGQAPEIVRQELDSYTKIDTELVTYMDEQEERVQNRTYIEWSSRNA